MSLAKPDQLAMAGAPWHAVAFLPVHFWDSGHVFCSTLHASAEELGEAGRSKKHELLQTEITEILLCLCYLSSRRKGSSFNLGVGSSEKLCE